MFENSVYSILSPESFANILFKDPTRKVEAARTMKMTAQDLYELGVIDGIIPEDPEGNWVHPEKSYKAVKEVLHKELDLMMRMSAHGKPIWAHTCATAKPSISSLSLRILSGASDIGRKTFTMS